MPYTGGEDHTPWDFMSPEERAAKEAEWKRNQPPKYRYFMEDTTLWRAVSGSPPEWRAPDGSWMPNERRTSLNLLIEHAVETDQNGRPLRREPSERPDPEEAPGSLNDFKRRLYHLRHYLEHMDFHPEVKRDLNKLWHGYEPNGALLTKDSKPVGPNWRMLEALKRQ